MGEERPGAAAPGNHHVRALAIELAWSWLANPLESIGITNSVRFVMKNGPWYHGNTLNEVRPRQRQMARLWWIADQAPGHAKAPMAEARSLS